MDIAACAKRVFIALVHNTRDGKPKLLRCQLPITAPGVVKMVVTDLGLFDVTPEGFQVRELAPRAYSGRRIGCAMIRGTLSRDADTRLLARCTLSGVAANSLMASQRFRVRSIKHAITRLEGVSFNTVGPIAGEKRWITTLHLHIYLPIVGVQSVY